MSVLILLALPLSSLAQEARGVAEHVVIADAANIQNGHLISFDSSGYHLAATPYDANLAGVAALTPAVAWSNVGSSGTVPLVKSGTAAALVSSANGNIAPGDWLTSSETPGVAIKATQAGMMIGRARQAYESDDGSQVVPITIVVDRQFAVPDQQVSGLPRSFGEFGNLLATGTQIATSGVAHISIRFLLAVLVLVVSLTFAYWIYARSTTNTITALGRNPLARVSILASTATSLGIATIIVVVGIVLALIILGL